MTRMVPACVSPGQQTQISFRNEPFPWGCPVLALPSLLALAAVLGFIALEVALAYA